MVLEAMAYGALSISTDQPPMTELLGRAATYYPARTAAGLASCIEEVLALPEADGVRQREAARDRVRQFTWERTAAETVAELRRVLE